MNVKAATRAQRQARRLFRSCVIGGRLDAMRVRAAARRLAGSRRRGDLAVLVGLQRLVRLDRDRHTAVVEAATTLPGDVRDDIRSALARAYGSALQTSFVETPALIGGVRIKVGSHVYDGSIRGRLAAAAGRLGIRERTAGSKGMTDG
jgi:F-type H+-transporting ATPase subunit delta